MVELEGHGQGATCMWRKRSTTFSKVSLGGGGGLLIANFKLLFHPHSADVKVLCANVGLGYLAAVLALTEVVPYELAWLSLSTLPHLLRKVTPGL